MADAPRFPHLALPFAIVGGVAGWLSAGLALHPIVLPVFSSRADIRIVMAWVTALLGAAAGWLIQRWCSGKRYLWQLDTPDPDVRPPSDSWVRHSLTILLAGATAGAVFYRETWLCTLEEGLLGGVAAATLFLPVCIAVVSAARRARRARLGSLVARSDRRAIWSVLAIALLIASLAALPDWPAPHAIPLYGPGPAVVLLFLSVGCILFVLVADLLALRRATWMLSPGLARRDPGDPVADDTAISRLDLGLGDDLHARISRTGAVYRGRDRTLALVQGDAARAMDMLRRAIRRGALGLAVAALVTAAHVGAASDRAFAAYEEIRCDQGIGKACGAAALHGGAILATSRDPHEQVLLYERGCDRADGASCMSLAKLYRGEQGIDRDVALVALFEYRAAQRGLCPDGTRLVRGFENVCVDPLDPRR